MTLPCLSILLVTALTQMSPNAQEAKLIASNSGFGGLFGWDVAMSGDTIVVGARAESSGSTGVNGNQQDLSAPWAGAVYVFVRDEDGWSQQAYIKASNTDADDSFGISVAIDGDTLVVGALDEDSSATGVNGDEANNDATDSGAAYVFVRNGTTWTQQAYLKASNTGDEDNFGLEVEIHGDTIVVGAIDEASSATGVNGDQGDDSAPRAGAAYVFVRNGTSWSQQAYLKASNSEAGDGFGSAAAVWDDTIVIGARDEASGATEVDGDESDNSAPGAGAGYVFVRNGTSWSQQAYLKGAVATDGDAFGGDAALVGDRAVIGATGVDVPGSSNYGAADVFVRNGTTWSHEARLQPFRSHPAIPPVSRNFGWGVAMETDRIAVTRFFASSLPEPQGAAYVFQLTEAGWTPHAFLQGVQTEGVGNSLAMSGETVAVGARFAGSGQGATYVLRCPPSSFQDDSPGLGFGGGVEDGTGDGTASGGAQQGPAALAPHLCDDEDSQLVRGVHCQEDLGHGSGAVTLSVCGEALAHPTSAARLVLEGASPGAKILLLAGELAARPRTPGLSVAWGEPLGTFRADANGTFELPVRGSREAGRVCVQALILTRDETAVASNVVEVVFGSP